VITAARKRPGNRANVTVSFIHHRELVRKRKLFLTSRLPCKSALALLSMNLNRTGQAASKGKLTSSINFWKKIFTGREIMTRAKL